MVTAISWDPTVKQANLSRSNREFPSRGELTRSLLISLGRRRVHFEKHEFHRRITQIRGLGFTSTHGTLGRPTPLPRLHALAHGSSQARAKIDCLTNFLHLLKIGGDDLVDGDRPCLRRWTGTARRSEGPKLIQVPYTKTQRRRTPCGRGRRTRTWAAARGWG